MPEKIRIYGDVSKAHEDQFLFIKGLFACKSNGEAFEQLIDIVYPVALAKAAALSSKG